MKEQRRGEPSRAFAELVDSDRSDWVNPLWVGQAFDEWCADLDAQAAIDQACRQRAAEIDAKGGKEKKVDRSDVLPVLAALARRAKPWTLTADLTVGQISTVTAQSTKSVEACLSIARQLDHIVNVTKERKPAAGRAGRAPKRRLLFLVDRVERIASASRRDSPDELGRELSRNGSVCRPSLNSSLTNTAADRADEVGRTRRQQLLDNVIGEIASKKGVTPHVIRVRDPRLSRAARERVDQLDDAIVQHIAPDDDALVAYLADASTGIGGSITTWQQIEERAAAHRAAQPTSTPEQLIDTTPPKGIPE